MIPMVKTASEGLGIDGRSLDALRREAARDPKAAARQAAVQFESVFMQMVIKSMRDATTRSGLTDSSSVETFTGMLDTQLTQQLSGKHGGLADMIEKQLSRHMTPAGTDPIPGGLPTSLIKSHGGAMPADPVKTLAPVSRQGAPAAFVQKMDVHAKAAERATGVPASFILGQAALESGWGRGEIRHADGTAAFNLFGIKATGGWKGATTDVLTTEYVGGKAIKTVERFRAYASYTEAFSDYARMISSNPRYSGVLKDASSAESFANGMQRAGYATDPGYAGKLSRTINQTLALQRALA
jgi:peptidoglycan hydrolase FlgJ